MRGRYWFVMSAFCEALFLFDNWKWDEIVFPALLLAFWSIDFVQSNPEFLSFVRSHTSGGLLAAWDDYRRLHGWRECSKCGAWYRSHYTGKKPLCLACRGVSHW